MNIVPSSTIHLLKNVPLNNTYDDTIQFSSKADQINYFGRASLHVASFNNQSYQRYDKGVLRIQALADDLYECNYMCFQNTGHSSNPKWFYAFVTSVDYVNENCTNITYEIDVMQTYLFDFEVGMCFVEREHTALDNIGDNIVEENVALGEYFYDDYKDFDEQFPVTGDVYRLKDYAVVIMSCKVYTGTVLTGKYDGCIQGATLYGFYVDNATDIATLNSFIQGYTQVPDELIAMYMVPRGILGPFDEHTHIITEGRNGFYQDLTMTNTIKGADDEHPTKFGNYTPRNNKMYIYPYNYLYVGTNSGDEMRLRYEFFNDGSAHFKLTGTITPPVQLCLRPAGYKGTGTEGLVPTARPLFTQALTLDNYPMCSWATDYYDTWISQNLVPMGLNIVSKALPAISMSSSATELIHGASVKNSIGLPYWKNIRTTNDVTSKNTSFSPTEKFSSAAQIASELYTAHIHSDDIRGTKFTANNDFANKVHTFFFARARITEEYAKIIDNYFTMFGYAVRKVKVPVIFNDAEADRPHWNYLKTANCVLSKSNCPVDVANSIIAIFNNGITFWKNADEIGQYGRNNRPVPLGG